MDAIHASETQEASHDALVVAERLGVRRRGQWLIRNVDLSVSPGEIVTLIGPNGSGKTTTLRAILGVLRLDEGRAALAPGIRIGYVPQRLTIDRTLPLTVRRFMALTRRHDEVDIRKALEETGVADLIDATVQDVSGGEFQRILLARALVHGPQLLVLDEPVQNVDFTGEIALYELIRDIRDRLGCGVLLVSHDLHIVMAETDTVVCLNTHVCCSGAPQSVAQDPAYADLFGSRAADAIAIYRHEHDHTHAPDGTVVPLPSPNSVDAKPDAG